MPRSTTLSANVAAFLDTIAYSDTGEALCKVTDDGYNVLCGATPANPLTFSDYSKHPGDPSLGEARFYNAKLDSTAAGRYQINWPTYKDIAARVVAVGFEPETQDELCVEILHVCGALDLIEAGKFDAAVAAAAGRWASFPGSTAGQHQQQLQYLQSVFVAAGGTIVE